MQPPDIMRIEIVTPWWWDPAFDALTFLCLYGLISRRLATAAGRFLGRRVTIHTLIDEPDLCEDLPFETFPDGRGLSYNRDPA